MIAVDTNVLVYAHRRDSVWHAVARARIAELAESKSAWAVAWPCLHEFTAIVTHPRIYAPPTTLADALDQVAAWLESPSLTPLSETDGYWKVLRATLEEARISGPQVHDARVAALCRHHGVTELWTGDRDFSRFPWLAVRNPLVGS